MLARTFLVMALLAGAVTAAPPVQAAGEVARRAMITAAMNGRATPSALESLAQLATNGDGGAADTLGFVYAKGRGIGRDLPRAFRWYMKAAAIGQPEAMVNSVLVWRAMRRAQQDEAEALLKEALDAPTIARLKGMWTEAVDTIQAREEAAKSSGGAKPK